MVREDAFIHYLSRNYTGLSATYNLLLSFDNLDELLNNYNHMLYSEDKRNDEKLKYYVCKYVNNEKEILEEEKTFFASLVRKEIKYTTVWSRDYPDKLKDLVDPPSIIYYKGKLPGNNNPSIAIVGARECSDYGAKVTREFAKELAINNCQIISGMARGIDGIAHRSAIEVEGNSFGILGTGVDIEYPKENADIYSKILNDGGLISEFEPGEKAIGFHFPMRNRIISGLSDALLVVEAREKSGTLITVSQALEQGKEVFAIPGRITDGLSDGCNKLISEGCNIALKPKDVIDGLNIIMDKYDKYDVQNIPVLMGEELILYNILSSNPLDFDGICSNENFVGREDIVFEILINLQMKGIVYKNCEKYFINIL